MPTRLNRADFASIPGMTPKLLRGLEDQAQSVQDASDTATAAVEATQGINAATVLVLSANDAFDNERILAVDGLTLADSGPGKTLTLRLKYPYRINGGYRLTWNLFADSNVTVPTIGTLATTDLGGQTYADDTAAAAGGVAVGELYRKPSGVVGWRQA